ncbi:MAG: hypothetical protein U5K54_14095 [Cytophagales bacterium]|nr:hypothetical protein [Cytophagales bacterium]
MAVQGYGENEGVAQRTSTLRHFLETVPANSSALVEPIDAQVFRLANEYWVSYYVGPQIYDRKYVFVPDTICEENLIFIKELEKEGVQHSIRLFCA